MGLLLFIAVNGLLAIAIFGAIRHPTSAMAFLKELIAHPVALGGQLLFIGSCLIAGWGIISAGRMSWPVPTPWGATNSIIFFGLLAIAMLAAGFAYSQWELHAQIRAEGAAKLRKTVLNNNVRAPAAETTPDHSVGPGLVGVLGGAIGTASLPRSRTALLMNHYDWKSSVQECSKCGWTGLGSAAELGDTFAEGAEYHCPKCNHYFKFVAYPTIEESLLDPRAPDADRKFAEIVDCRVKKNPSS